MTAPATMVMTPHRRLGITVGLVVVWLGGLVVLDRLGGAWSARLMLWVAGLSTLGLGLVGLWVTNNAWRHRLALLASQLEGIVDAGEGTIPVDVAAPEVPGLGRALNRLRRDLSAGLARLRDERDLLGRVLDGMQEGVLVLDGDGRLAMVNPALRRTLLLGADVIGKTPLEVIRNAELKRALDLAAAKGEAMTELELGDLRPRRLLVHVARLGGERPGLIAVFVDVTELRRLETLRRDFVANVSHELRTPIASVRSASETLRSVLGKSPERAGEFLDIVERNAERLLNLVEDLLDLSRIESKELRLDPEALDVAAVGEHVVSLLRSAAARKEVRILVEGQGSAPRALADRRALEQVLNNLVDNAIKYCPAGSQVHLTAEAEAPSSVRLRVTDNGPGIEAKHLPRLFERFYRVDAGRSRELGGTGLGLAIVRHLVEAMGGSISVESTPGKGTIFSVRLPAAPGPSPSQRRPDVT